MKTEYYLIELRRCTGEGQSTCRRCTELGKWSLCWTSWSYKVLIDGEPMEGCFCFDHAQEVATELDRDLNRGVQYIECS